MLPIESLFVIGYDQGAVVTLIITMQHYEIKLNPLMWIQPCFA